MAVASLGYLFATVAGVSMGTGILTGKMQIEKRGWLSNNAFH